MDDFLSPLTLGSCCFRILCCFCEICVVGQPISIFVVSVLNEFSRVFCHGYSFWSLAKSDFLSVSLLYDFISQRSSCNNEQRKGYDYCEVMLLNLREISSHHDVNRKAVVICSLIKTLHFWIYYLLSLVQHFLLLRFQLIPEYRSIYSWRRVA